MDDRARPAGDASLGEDRWTIQTFLDTLAARGERPALRWIRRGETGDSSCAKLADRALRMAAALLRDGLQVGEPVALIARNGPEWVVARLALGAAGALVVALDDLSGEDDLRGALSDCECRRILASARHVPVLRRIAGGSADVILIDEDIDAVEGARRLDVAEAGSAERLPELAPDTPAMLVYTSGTTGPPKSFVLTYAHLWSNIRALAAERLIGPSDRVLLPLPLHHVYPLVVGLLTSLQSGATVVLADAAPGRETIEAFRASGATVLVGVPRLYAAILSGTEAAVARAGRVPTAAFKAALRAVAWLRRRFGISAGGWLFGWLRARIAPSLRLLVSGGARLEPEVLWPLVALGFEVRSGYGLAETASIFTGNLPGRERLGSEGLPFQGGEVRIAAPDEDDVGEILLRGPNVFAGYRGQPGGGDAFTSDGWFRTGDLGRLDQDGFLYVTGRTKEMLVLGGGKKVSPEYLEKVYGDHPAIKEIAVIERNGSPVALIVPDLEAVHGQRVDDTIRVALSAKSQDLPSYQRIGGFALVREPLPRTRLGKYRRFLLPDIYDRAQSGVVRAPAAEPSAEDRALLARPRARRLWRLLEERYSRQALSLDANLQLDLGVDSLEWLGLLMALEERLGLRLDERDVAGAQTVRDLINLAESQPAEAAGAPGHEPEAPADMSWIEPLGPGLRLLGALLYWTNRLLMRALFRLRVEGLEHLPRSGPYILVANHASDLDPLVVAASLRLAEMRRIYWGGAASRLFARRWMRPLWRALHVMPVDERLPASSLALATAVLKRGDRLVWFPETWRSPDGALQRFQSGVGRLIAESGAPAVPAYIAGTFDAMPRDRRIPRPGPVRVSIAEPIAAEVLARGADEVAPHAQITAALRQAVVALAGRETGGASQ